MTSSLSRTWIAVSIAGAISGGLLFGVTAASAGECPAGKVVASDGQKPGATAHKGVTEKLLGQLELAKEKVAKSPGTATTSARL